MVGRTRLREDSPAKVRRNEYRHQLNLISDAPTLAYAHDIAFRALINPDLGGVDLSLEERVYRGTFRRVMLREGRCYSLVGMRNEADEVMSLYGPRRRVLETHFYPPKAGQTEPTPPRSLG